MMICEKTGWSFHYVRDEISWINIRMMLADAITYRTDTTEDKITEGTDDDLLKMAAKQNKHV